MARLVLRLFGRLEATLDGAPITAYESAKVRGLLAYLAAEADRPQRREALAGLLWPDWPQQSAMRNLRNALADLRQNIGDRDAEASGLLAHSPFLLITRESVQLNRAADAWVDVIEFEQGIRADEQGSRDQGSAIGYQREGSSEPQSTISNPQSSIDNLQSTIRNPSLSRSLPGRPLAA